MSKHLFYLDACEPLLTLFRQFANYCVAPPNPPYMFRKKRNNKGKDKWQTEQYDNLIRNDRIPPHTIEIDIFNPRFSWSSFDSPCFFAIDNKQQKNYQLGSQYGWEAAIAAPHCTTHHLNHPVG